MFWDTKDGKGPRDSGWARQSYLPEHYRAGMQTGVKLGTPIAAERYLHAAAFDSMDRRVYAIAKRLLPASGFGTYRDSKKPRRCSIRAPRRT